MKRVHRSIDRRIYIYLLTSFSPSSRQSTSRWDTKWVTKSMRMAIVRVFFRAIQLEKSPHMHTRTHCNYPRRENTTRICRTPQNSSRHVHTKHCTSIKLLPTQQYNAKPECERIFFHALVSLSWDSFHVCWKQLARILQITSRLNQFVVLCLMLLSDKINRFASFSRNKNQFYAHFTIMYNFG